MGVWSILNFSWNFHDGNINLDHTWCLIDDIRHVRRCPYQTSIKVLMNMKKSRDYFMLVIVRVEYFLSISNPLENAFF